MSASLRRVLIVAEHASTRLGGEAILPWHYFRLLRARSVDAHLIVHERTRAELEQALAADLDHVHFVRDQALQKLFYRAGRFLPRRIDEATLGLANQLLTQHAQRAVVRTLAVPGTVIHQPIPVSPRFPSLLSGLGAPLVVGPLNGGMEWPAAFRSAEAAWSRAAIALGRGLTDIVNAIFPGKRKAAIVLVANARTRAALPSNLEGEVFELVENGVDAGHWQAETETKVEARFIFIGRLVDWKALDLAIDAIARTPGATLDVVGDGPMLTAWKAHAAAAGVAERVHFHGFQSQAVCAKILAGCCALVLPSLYECGGAVVLEAMAMSTPVIATAWGGPLDYLDASCGFLIEPSSRQALVSGFARAMAALIASPELQRDLGTAGRTRMLQHFDWNRKIDAILDIYARALSTS